MDFNSYTHKYMDNSSDSKQGFECIIELYTILQEEEDAPPILDRLDCKKRKRIRDTENNLDFSNK